MKTGFWLKGGKGKLAGATVYQQNGETLMREVVTPTNPKTEKQIIQRIIMHTVMQAYSKMKDICDHSFEGLKKGQPTMSDMTRDWHLSYSRSLHFLCDRYSSLPIMMFVVVTKSATFTSPSPLASPFLPTYSSTSVSATSESS